MHRQTRRCRDRGPQRGDVDPGTHHENRFRRLGRRAQPGDHLPEFGDRVNGMQAAAIDPNNHAVDGPHDRQGGGGALEEQQRGALVPDGLTDGLRERAGGVQFGDQDDVVDAVRPQDLAQPGRRRMVGPRDADGFQVMPALNRALPGAEDRGDHLIGRIRTGPCRAAGEVHAVAIDGDPVRFLALDQDHADRRWCHRHTKNDVHYPSTVCAGRTRCHWRRVPDLKTPTTGFIGPGPGAVTRRLSGQI